MAGLLRHALLIAAVIASTPPAAAQSTAEIGGLRFIGAVTVPNDTMVDGTLVGGLSGIDYDADADLWYLISDDKSEKSPARFYTAKLAFVHGDNGAGLGASHQTGWTGVIARIMHLFATTTPEQILQLGKIAAVTDVHRTPSREIAAVAVAGGS